MQKKVKAVYFGDADIELLNYAEKQPNFSRYIKELIQADMQLVIPTHLRNMIEELINKKIGLVDSVKQELDIKLLENLF